MSDNDGTWSTPKGELVLVPPGHGIYIFPTPETTDVIESAAAHVAELLDHDERNDIDG
jgi:hypothetical protein